MKVVKSPQTEYNPNTGAVIGEVCKTKVTAEYETIKVAVTITSETDGDADPVYKDVLKLLRAFEDGNQISMDMGRDPETEAVEGFDENGMPTA